MSRRFAPILLGLLLGAEAVLWGVLPGGRAFCGSWLPEKLRLTGNRLEAAAQALASGQRIQECIAWLRISEP